MLLDDAPSIKAALATMNPTARTATQVLANKLFEAPSLLQDDDELKQQALFSCAAAFCHAGYDLEKDDQRFMTFLEDHVANVLDIAVSILLVTAKKAETRRMWGNIGKVAALAGAAALGAFFS